MYIAIKKRVVLISLWEIGLTIKKGCYQQHPHHCSWIWSRKQTWIIQTCQRTIFNSTDGSWAKTLQICHFFLHVTLVNRNGDKPTISANSFDATILFHSILNVSLHMHHTNHTTICSDDHSPWSLLLVLTAGRSHILPGSDGSQLLALQRDFGRGAGEQEGAGVQCWERRPNVEPLAGQGGVAAARARHFLHGRRDALMPLCWGCSRQLLLEWRAINVAHFCIKLYRIFTIDIKSAGARHNSSLIFRWHCVPARVVFCCRLDEETNISCGILGHAEINRQRTNRHL